MIKYLFIYFLLLTISVTAGEPGDQKNTLNKQENNLTKEEKTIEDPFFKDFTKHIDAGYIYNIDFACFINIRPNSFYKDFIIVQMLLFWG